MVDYILLITAGGVGKRFGKPYPKQLEKINGKPLIEWTIGFFEKIKPAFCVLTYPEGFESDFKFLENRFSFPLFLVKGGKERFFSVKNGVEFVFQKENEKDIPLLVHDGVRPFLSLEVVKEVIEKTKEKGCAVPYIPLSGTLRRLESGEFTEVIDRKNAVAITTPQGAKLSILHTCFQKAKRIYTDESTMLSDLGFPPVPVVDWQLNIKITHYEDRILAETLAGIIFSEKDK